MTSFKYVVLGGGNASGYAAAEFVRQGVAAGELLIITDEAVVAYERPALSKAYLFPTGFARLPGFHTCVGGGGDRQAPEWYKEKGIEYKVDTKVTAVDVAAKALTTAAGETIKYEKLILATGARTTTLADFKTKGAELGGLYTLRNVADADLLLEGVAKAKAAGGKVVIVGGGYIGMEVAAALVLQGLAVTQVFPEPHMMPRLFTPELAAAYEAVFKAKGVDMIKGEIVTELEGKDGQVTAAILKSGVRVETDLVVVGVGARPNVELFKGQLDFSTAPQGGLLVDGSLRTSNPDVYAVGDIAAFTLLKYGGPPVRAEHVTNARQSAVHAVKAIFGATEAYDYLPFFYSRLFNLSWQFYGSSEGSTVFFGDTSSGKFGTYWVKDGKVVGAFLESGSAEENAAIKALAVDQPDAPSNEELAAKGISFAQARL